MSRKLLSRKWEKRQKSFPSWGLIWSKYSRPEWCEWTVPKINEGGGGGAMPANVGKCLARNVPWISDGAGSFKFNIRFRSGHYGSRVFAMRFLFRISGGSRSASCDSWNDCRNGYATAGEWLIDMICLRVVRGSIAIEALLRENLKASTSVEI